MRGYCMLDGVAQPLACNTRVGMSMHFVKALTCGRRCCSSQWYQGLRSGQCQRTYQGLQVKNIQRVCM